MTEGKTTIDPEVLQSIVKLTTLSVPGVSRLFMSVLGVNRLIKRKINEGIRIEIIDDTVYADVHIVLNHDVNINQVSKSIQQEVARAISDMVGMQVGGVNIHIEDIDYPIEAEF